MLHGDSFVDSSWIKPCYDVLSSNGALVTFCDWKTSNQWKDAIELAGFTVVSQVIWNRVHHGMGDLTGAFAPMHDIVWYATKGRRVFKNGRPKSVITDKRPSSNENYDHPTCKPVSLMKGLIHSICVGSDLPIFDPFMGSGSTAVASVELGRKFIGVEIDPHYYNTAKCRVVEAERLNKNG